MPAPSPRLRCQVASVLLGTAAVLAVSAPVLAQGSQPQMRMQPQPGSVPANGVTGLWIDHTGDGAVEIAPCAANAPWCSSNTT